MPNSHTPSLTKVGMSSSRTNIRSIGKFSTLAARSFLPCWMRKPASRSSSRLYSDKRPDFWIARCRRPPSIVILFSEALHRHPIGLKGLLPQETRHAHDGRRADAGRIVDVAIGKVGGFQQPRDMPALGERAHLGRRAQV